MRLLALLRNVNQGQRGHPSTDDVLGAFHDVGHPDAAAFQSNGTVVFEGSPSDDLPEALTVVLAERCGLERDVFVIPLDNAIAIVDGHRGAPDAARRELTLHRGDTIDIDDAETTRRAAHLRCRLAASGPGWVVTANERDRDSNATPLVERITEGPATSRGLPTLLRLVTRVG